MKRTSIKDIVYNFVEKIVSKQHGKNKKQLFMKRIIHFFEIAVFAIRLSVMNNEARRAFFSSIRPVL
ncbi:MAG TPA: hypothetical protein VJ111_14220 [Chitinophagaceae bacterium]|nr:hypothetical protein [Chitinophagaceae bacterium]